MNDQAPPISKSKILITGAAGSIGSELCRQLKDQNIIYAVDIDETRIFELINELGIVGRVGDIRDETTMRDVFSDFRPEIVYHCAAYKHVTPMEWTPIEAIKTNILGLYNVINFAQIYETKKFVFISTDKAVQSTSIMGATKRVGEIMVKNKGLGFVVVRFGNVLGSRGSVIPIWEKQINEGKSITITDPQMTRYMMTIEEACSLVIQAAKESEGGEIIVMDMGKPIKILDLAKEIIKQSRHDVPIEVTGIRTGEYLTEKIMFEEEEKNAVKKGNFFIIK